MKKCVFLTMDSLEGYVCFDHLLYEPLRRLGWEIEEVSWRKAHVSWDDYDVVLIRSTWDYMFAPEQFLRVLETINRSKAHLENSLDIVKWNIEKTYLRDMEERGMPCIPTLWRDRFEYGDGRGFFEALGVAEIIVKPILSAGAKSTYRIHADSMDDYEPTLVRDFSSRAFMVQPFVPEIVEPGEFSLFFFAGEHSHTIQKKPKQNDFRVQEEHGGILTRIEPDPVLLASATRALELMDEKPLYVRVDLVLYRDKPVLMELELIEPSLYFNIDGEAPQRFAEAFDRWMLSRSGND